MLKDLSQEAGKFELKLHMGKTVVLTNRSTGIPASVMCGAGTVKVAGVDDTEKHLGHKLSTLHFHETEFSNRLASVWAACFNRKDVLCNRKVPE